MTPLERYREELQQADIVHDPVQERAVERMQRLYDELAESELRTPALLQRIAGRILNRRSERIRGIYLWGGVGRGKTWIVDSFYECLPFERKMRIHFHRFMQRVHNELRKLRDIEYPLRRVADGFARQARVICLDEFHVNDITDAMLLGGLLEAIYDQGMVLVATSNEHPDQLYRDGLQRDRFLPAIELIKQNSRIVHLDAASDYRFRYLEQAEIYHSPLDNRAEQMLSANFRHLSPHPGTAGAVIEIRGREIPTVRCADGVAWFDFYSLCDGPRGPADYIEIGRLFQTVLIAGVPQMGEQHNDMARRFITLVDEFYDRRVKLILTAATGITGLYQGRRLQADFARTVSRLVEMQSREYLTREHLS